MTMTTTCNACGFVLPEPAPGQPCPRCGGPTRTDAVMSSGAGHATAMGHPRTVVVTSRYAGVGYADALGEAGARLPETVASPSAEGSHGDDRGSRRS